MNVDLIWFQRWFSVCNKLLFNARRGHWVQCQQLFLASHESWCRWDWYLALSSPDNDSSVGFSLWWWSFLMLIFQLVPSWLKVRSGLPEALPVFTLSISFSPLGVKNVCPFTQPPLLPPLSLPCPPHRAITGVHASTASICQHDHVSEEGTLRRHGFCCSGTRRHHRSQWWRGGAWRSPVSWLCLAYNCIYIYVCVCVSPVAPMNLSASIWCFFLLY